MIRKNSKKLVEKIAKRKKIFFLTATILVLVTILGFGAYSKIQRNEKITLRQVEEHKPAVIDSELLKQIPGDIVLGSPDAPVTFIEYASLSCPHCAHFYNDVFNQIKTNYIDTNVVKFIYRDFPLNQSAMLASTIALCHAKNTKNDPKEYYKLIKALFKTQESWAFEEGFFEKLRSIAKLDGITEKEFQDCANNPQIINDILENRIKAAKELQIDSTPTFIINGFIMGGGRPYDDFKTAIDQALTHTLNKNNETNEHSQDQNK